MSQQALSLESNVPTATISHIENGRNPTWATVKRLAKGLDKSLAEVAALAEELESKERGDSAR